MTICERVFSLLADAGREQRELAKFIGVPAKTVSTWKVRGTNPGAEYIAAIAEFFSVSVDYILTGEEKEYRLSPADELAALHRCFDRKLAEGDAGAAALAVEEIENYERLYGVRLAAAPSVAAMRAAVGRREGRGA